MGPLDLDAGETRRAADSIPGVLEGDFRPARGDLALPPGVFRRPDLALWGQAAQGLLAEQEHGGHSWLGQEDLMEARQEESGRGV